jgi:hypothetical protein
MLIFIAYPEYCASGALMLTHISAGKKRANACFVICRAIRRIRQVLIGWTPRGHKDAF